jgi:hypothetical protein
MSHQVISDRLKELNFDSIWVKSAKLWQQTKSLNLVNN